MTSVESVGEGVRLLLDCLEVLLELLLPRGGAAGCGGVGGVALFSRFMIWSGGVRGVTSCCCGGGTRLSVEVFCLSDGLTRLG